MSENSDSDLENDFGTINKKHDYTDDIKNSQKLLVATPEGLIKSNIEAEKKLPSTDEQDNLLFSSNVGLTSAILILEALKSDGELTSIEFSHLKRRYIELCGYLSKTRENEFSLVQFMKKNVPTLDELEKELNKVDHYPDNYNSKGDIVREQLLLAKNRLLQIQERCDELDYALNGLTDEKHLLKKQYDRLPNQEANEILEIKLEKVVNDLQSEIKKRSDESNQLTQSLKSLQELCSQLANSVKEAEYKIRELKNDFSNLDPELNQIERRNGRLTKQKDEAEQLKCESIDEQKQRQMEIDGLELVEMQLENEGKKLENFVSKKQQKLQELKSRNGAINVHTRQLEDMFNQLTNEKLELESQMEYLRTEAQSFADKLNRQTRLRDLALRDCRKSQSVVGSMKDAVRFVDKMHHDATLLCARMKQSNDMADTFKKRTQLNQEIKALRIKCAEQAHLSDAEQAKLHESLALHDDLNCQLANVRIESVELVRLVTIKADEREQKCRDLHAAYTRYARVVDDIKMKKLQVDEYEKSLANTQKRLKEFANLYNAIKEERNNCVSSIQLLHQQKEEINEKLRICTNEMDILVNNLSHNKSLLSKQNKKIVYLIGDRDLLRNEISKLNVVSKESGMKKEQNRFVIDRHNLVIRKGAKDLDCLRNCIGEATKLRNSRALNLVEQNEELCVLQECFNLNEHALKKGQLAMNQLEGEMRMFDREKHNLQRFIQLGPKNVVTPHDQLATELASNQMQLDVCKDRVVNLEKAAVDPTAPVMDGISGGPLMRSPLKQAKSCSKTSQQFAKRCRTLNMGDLEPAELRQKVDQIQVALVDRERCLVELNMLFEVVQSLVHRLEQRTCTNKDLSIKVAVESNTCKRKTMESTQQLKAATAELSMLMAKTYELQNEIKKRRTYVDECNKRLESGLPPYDEAEIEWEQYVKSNHWKSEKSLAYESMNFDDYVCWTTAPERPNAYILKVSERDNLEDVASRMPSKPIPFGANAPFRPSEQGSHMRHYRKPSLKPLDI